MPLGGLVTLFLLLPNLLVVFFPPTSLSGAAVKKSTSTTTMEIVERIGQASAFVTPFFYPLRVQGNLETTSLAGMILALIFHYINGSGRPTR